MFCCSKLPPGGATGESLRSKDHWEHHDDDWSAFAGSVILKDGCYFWNMKKAGCHRKRPAGSTLLNQRRQMTGHVQTRVHICFQKFVINEVGLLLWHVFSHATVDSLRVTALSVGATWWRHREPWRGTRELFSLLRPLHEYWGWSYARQSYVTSFLLAIIAVNSQ